MISRLRRVDWDFAGSLSDSPFSAIHWHPSRFASQIPATLIGLLSQPGELVLDPFVGSGTTLVEAQRLRRRSVGIELNPIAHLMARAKTLSESSDKIVGILDAVLKDTASATGSTLPLRTRCTQRREVPATVQAQKWYTERVLKDLAALWSLVNSYRDIKRTLTQAAFSAILLPVCRETRHWGYVCDNSTPKTEHEGDVFAEFRKVLHNVKSGYQKRDEEWRAQSKMSADFVESKVICGDARQVLKDIPRESVNLIVTSPPYFGVSDYIKSQRLSMEWSGYSIEPLRQIEIGARSKRHRKTALQEYIDDLHSIFVALKDCLHPDGVCALIIGESAKRQAVLEHVRKSLKGTGFDMMLDQNRRVSSQRRQTPSITGEHLFVLSV